MSCVSSKRPSPPLAARFRRKRALGVASPRSGRAAGYTLLEILVAVTVTMVFIGGVYTTFFQISKGHHEAEVRMEAMRNGRAALATMTDEIKGATSKGATGQFRGTFAVLPYGDAIDNDGDGAVDEEIVNGVLDTTASTTGTQSVDRHASLGGTLLERPNGVDKADLGDTEVDIDAKFGRDSLVFEILPKVPTPFVTSKRVTYAITEYEGQANVLVRQTEIFQVGNTTPAITREPLAFGVAALDLLYWNPNAQPADQGWVTRWDASQADTFAAPQLTLPATVYIRLTLFADVRPPEALLAGQPVRVITVETIVNIEEIIKSAQFPRPTL